jgi:hypothetical protein
MALEKAAKTPLFPLNLRLLSQKLKFWESFIYPEENVEKDWMLFFGSIILSFSAFKGACSLLAM